ncbi:MAG: hypothetical protein OEY19_11960, partial [Gammaproteobacteria bacterium]|nr:hypothetical protein [Gammaproteobacteria bacterium]
PLWLFALPITYVMLLGFMNYCHEILRTSVLLDQPDIRINMQLMHPFINTPATRILIFSFCLYIAGMLLPEALVNTLMPFVIVILPACLMVLSLETEMSRMFSIKLWIDFIRVLGIYYLLVVVLVFASYYMTFLFLFNKGSILSFVFALFFFMFYHRFVGLILRESESFTSLPIHWNLSDKARTAVINNQDILKYQRIIQSMIKKHSPEVFDDKMKLLMTRNRYDEADSLFQALTLLDNTDHAMFFASHYLPFLLRSHVDDRAPVQRVLDFCFETDEDFLMKQDLQNAVIARVLLENDFVRESYQLCKNFMRLRSDSDAMKNMVLVINALKKHPLYKSINEEFC